MSDGKDNPGALSDADKREDRGANHRGGSARQPAREDHVRAPTLHETAEGYDITGNLTLHGVAKRIQMSARADAGQHVAEVTLHQPDFGITPFKAMLGTLKVKPDVRVRITLPRLA